MEHRARLILIGLVLLLGLAVPALLTDLECMVGPSDCCACDQAGHPGSFDECGAASLAALQHPAPGAPRPAPVLFLAAPPAPAVPLAAAEPSDQRAPREGPPPLASGLRAPPA